MQNSRKKHIAGKSSSASKFNLRSSRSAFTRLWSLYFIGLLFHILTDQNQLRLF